MKLCENFSPLHVCLLGVVVHSCQDVTKFNQGPGYLELINSPCLKSWGRQQLRVLFKIPRQSGDRVKVYQDIPAPSKIIFESAVPQHKDYIDTNLTNKKNYKYSVKYFRSDGTVAATSVLADWSGWMYCMHEYLGSRSVGRVFFPGTHNSGSYMAPKAHHTISPSALADKYIYTQDENIEEQLIRGARYLDLRVGHYPNWFPISLSKEIWWINHDVIKIRPLIIVVNQIKCFLEKWTNEILILDFHRFPVGFEKGQTHDELAAYLKKEFGPLLHQVDKDQGWSITFNELWKTKARILLSYGKADVAAKYGFYPPVRQIWPDMDTHDTLIDFIKSHLPKVCSVHQMTAVMAELTPRASGILQNKYGGLRGLANIVNADITLLFGTDQLGETAQAVAVDFLSSTGIVSAAVLQNYKRSQKGHICN